MYRSFYTSVRGSSHVKEDLKCQDSSIAIVAEDGAWSLAVTADGHGGKPYFRSDIGSRIAVDSAVAVVRDYLEDMDTFLKAFRASPEKVLHSMEASILSKWNSAVHEYDEQNKELTEWEKDWCSRKKITVNESYREELYGTTLVMALLSSSFAIGIQNGDGACVSIYDNGNPEFFLPQQENDYLLNITNSLCSSKAMEHFIHHYILLEPSSDALNVPCNTDDETVILDAALEEVVQTPADEQPETETPSSAEADGDNEAKSTPAIEPQALPICLLVSTDGLINSCTSNEGFLTFNRRVLSLVNEDNFRESLEKYLYERSAKGSADDISISFVFRDDIDLDGLRLMPL